ncbi:hypothetical protein ColTof4_14086 [Colletotrichum tofieldiae]|nr:hypothetical protein ColTof3_02998 [Colletotrichum tofieldiae]GKT81663.1 hypothetical protein ColTof4_14086 [Colletotrichum tofieldiae]GKT82680.1 hypothetical protein Ct61P_00530 [Colletotrichum tofieldiae]
MLPNVTNQGPVNLGVPHAPCSPAQATQDAHVRLQTFEANNQLKGSGDRRIGSCDRQGNRSQRVSAVIAAVDQLIPRAVDGVHAQGQAEHNQIPDLRGVGQQFSDGAADASEGSQ